MDENQAIMRLRMRAHHGRQVGLRTDFWSLPLVVQTALYGIAAELEEIADLLEGREPHLPRNRGKVADVDGLTTVGQEDTPKR